MSEETTETTEATTEQTITETDVTYGAITPEARQELYEAMELAILRPHLPILYTAFLCINAIQSLCQHQRMPRARHQRHPRHRRRRRRRSMIEEEQHPINFTPLPAEDQRLVENACLLLRRYVEETAINRGDHYYYMNEVFSEILWNYGNPALAELCAWIIRNEHTAWFHQAVQHFTRTYHENAIPHIPLLLQFYRSTSGHPYRVDIVLAFARLEQDAKSVLPTLRTTLSREPNYHLKREILHAIYEIDVEEDDTE